MENTDVFAQIQKISDLAPCGIGIFDPQSRKPVLLNQAYYDLVGYTPEEYLEIGMDFKALMFPQDSDMPDKSRAAFEQTGSAAGYEYRIVRRDGGVRWVKLDISTVALAEKPYAFCTFTDITPERTAASRLNLIAENIGSSLSLIEIADGKEQLLYANDAFFRYIGVSRAHYCAQMRDFDRTLLSSQDYEAIRRAAEQALKTRKPGEVTYQLLQPSGKKLWMQRRFAAIRQDTPNSYLLVSLTSDITKAKEIALKAALQQRNFQTVISELNAVVLEWNLKTNAFYASDAFQNYALGRIDPKEILNNTGSPDAIHPEDASQMAYFVQQTERGEPRAEVVLRMKMADGSYHWCRMIGFYYTDEQGSPDRTIGVIIDINEEHERTVMLSSLLNEIPGGVAILSFDQQLDCPYFSDGFARICERTREEVEQLLAENRLFRGVLAPADYPHFVETVHQAVAAKKPINLTCRYVRKDGDTGWLHLAATEMGQQNNHSVYYCIFTTPSDETALYRSIVEDSAIGVFVGSRKGHRVLYLNRVGKAISGLSTHQQFLNSSVSDLLTPLQKQPLLTQQQIDALREDAYTELHFDRGSLYLGIRARAMRWNGIDAYVLYMTDETVEHEQQKQLQKLIDGVPAGIGIYELRGSRLLLIYLNDAYYQMLGVKREDRSRFDGSNATEAVHPDDMGNITALNRRLLTGSNHASTLARILCSGGAFTWMKITASVIEREGSRIKIYAAFTDCNALVLAQQEMERHQLREQTMLASIPGGMAVYRLKKNGTASLGYVSEGFAKLTGYSVEECLSFSDINQFVLAEDMPKLEETLQTAMEKNEPVHTTYRIRTKSGQYILNRLDANLVTDASLAKDERAILYAVHTRVSDDALRTMREQKHYRTILDMLGIAYWEWKCDGSFYASEHYADYALSENPIDDVRHNAVLGDIVYPDDMPILKEFFAQGRRAEGRASVVLRMKMRGGGYQWTEIFGFREYDENGSTIRLSCILRNVNQEWVERNRRLQNALNDAQKANQAKTDFLSRVSCKFS